MNDPNGKEGPEVYAIQRGRSGWALSRRSLLSVAAAAGALPRGANTAPCVAGARSGSGGNLAISRDGRLLASDGNNGKAVKLWSLPDGALLKKLDLSPGTCYSLAFNPEGRLLAVGCADGTIELWSLPDGTLTQTLKAPGQYIQPISALAISPDGQTLVTGCQDGAIRVWSLPSVSVVKIMSAYGSVHSLVISPDGRRLFSGSDSGINLWSLPDGAQVYRYGWPATSLAVSADWTLAAAAYAQSILLLSGADWTQTKTLTIPGKSSSWIQTVAMSPDGRLLASGGNDDLLLLWSMPDGQLLKTLSPSANFSTNCAVVISPDGRLMASNYPYGSVMLWSLPDGQPAPVCLMDPAESTTDAQAVTYIENGVVYTTPSGSPIPVGAVCSCNTVKGAICSCVSACSCVSYTGCGVGVYYYPN